MAYDINYIAYTVIQSLYTAVDTVDTNLKQHAYNITI